MPVIPSSMFSKHPNSKPRYRPGDIVKTTKRARGTLTRYGEQIPLDVPAGTHGSVMEIAPIKPHEGYPPTWTYKIRLPGGAFWIRGGMLRLVERNPKLQKKGARK